MLLKSDFWRKFVLAQLFIRGGLLLLTGSSSFADEPETGKVPIDEEARNGVKVFLDSCIAAKCIVLFEVNKEEGTTPKEILVGKKKEKDWIGSLELAPPDDDQSRWLLFVVSDDSPTGVIPYDVEEGVIIVGRTSKAHFIKCSIQDLRRELNVSGVGPKDK